MALARKAGASAARLTSGRPAPAHGNNLCRIVNQYCDRVSRRDEFALRCVGGSLGSPVNQQRVNLLSLRAGPRATPLPG